MWTSIQVSLQHVWDDCLWRVVAVWRDDLETEPIVVVRTGRAPAYGLDDPVPLLRACAAAMAAEDTQAHKQGAATSLARWQLLD